MKDEEHIARINSKFSEDVVAELRTWQLSRVFRRDFNRMTYKMFLLAPKFTAQQRIILRLHEMQSALHVLENLVSKIPPPPAAEKTPPSLLSMRLVSPEARILFDVLVGMDVAMHRLLSQHDADTTEEICADFFAAYGRLKYALFRKKPERDTTAPAADGVAAATIEIERNDDQAESAPSQSFALKGLLDGLRKRFLG
jgi:hypothetical protein